MKRLEEAQAELAACREGEMSLLVSSAEGLVLCFLDRFEEHQAGPGFDSVIDDWKGFSITLNRPVTIQTISDTFSGIARDVDETGALILELPNGRRQRVVHGDCFHQ